MRITFKCKSNKTYVAINVAKFILPSGTTLTVDRTRTEWDFDESTGNFNMTWYHCYLHAINDCNIFSDEAYLEAEFEDLIADARVMLLIEEDADDDYEVDVLEWSVGE